MHLIKIRKGKLFTKTHELIVPGKTFSTQTYLQMMQASDVFLREALWVSVNTLRFSHHSLKGIQIRYPGWVRIYTDRFKSGKCEYIKAQITPDRQKRSFLSCAVPVSLVNPLELGRNQAGKQGSHSSSRDERLSYSSQPNIDLVRCLVEVQKLLCHNCVVHYCS